VNESSILCDAIADNSNLCIFFVAKVLLLKNIVTREELADDGEFEDIQEDVKGECSTYGIIESIIIPREKDGFRASAEGSIYVMYQNADMARAASAALSGRKFANRIVSVEYVSILYAFFEIPSIYFSHCNILCWCSLMKGHFTGESSFERDKHLC
jgi:hypothetical protein